MPTGTERINNININRVLWCCNNLGLDPYELAEKLSISPATFKRFLSGETGLTFNQLKAIGEYFNRGVLFFLDQKTVDDTEVFSYQFRTLTNQKPHVSPKVRAIIERAEYQREVFLSLQEDIYEDKNMSFTPPNFPVGNIAQAATITREWLNLSDENTFEGFRSSVEAKGILVILTNGYKGKWQIPKEESIIGFSLYFDRFPIIVVRKQASQARQTFTLFHELGHLLIHQSNSIDDENDLFSHKSNEAVANQFAGRLLIPDHYLDQIKITDFPSKLENIDSWLSPYRCKWGVSGETILRRLLSNGLLDQTMYTDYRNWKQSQPRSPVSLGGSRQKRYYEPVKIFGTSFVSTVIDAFTSEHITINKACSYLDNLKVEHIHKLIGYYGSI